MATMSNSHQEKKYPLRKPPWLRHTFKAGPSYEQTRSLLRNAGLHTVCQEARCPNLWHCFSKRTATFLILGKYCTRFCRFCAVNGGIPEPLDKDEPARVAETITRMNLKYAVITSVTRDDLPDGGASHFAATIKAARDLYPPVPVEVLVPDFQGNMESVATVLDAEPVVFNHNLETVPRLYKTARPGADYRRSLDLIKAARTISPDIQVKSGLMLGLGEKTCELRDMLQDLRNAGCSIVTLGQYLQPSSSHLPVVRYLNPAEFEAWGEEALKMGFSAVASGPLVRSSYNAAQLYSAAAAYI